MLVSSRVPCARFPSRATCIQTRMDHERFSALTGSAPLPGRAGGTVPAGLVGGNKLLHDGEMCRSPWDSCWDLVRHRGADHVAWGRGAPRPLAPPPGTAAHLPTHQDSAVS